MQRCFEAVKCDGSDVTVASSAKRTIAVDTTGVRATKQVKLVEAIVAALRTAWQGSCFEYDH